MIDTTIATTGPCAGALLGNAGVKKAGSFTTTPTVAPITSA